MGREASITPEQVHAVADAIKAEGAKPTLRAVRERLGTGSMGTIANLLQVWRDGQERKAVADLTLPPALHRAILDSMASELAAGRAPLEAELAEQRQVSADLAEENERLAALLERQAESRDALAAERSAAEGRAVQLAVDLAAAREESARDRQAAEAARTECAKALLRLEGMPKVEEEHRARVAAEQQAAVLAERVAGLEAIIAELRARAR